MSGRAARTERPRLAIVTSAAEGWRTIRRRWEDDLGDYSPLLMRQETYSRALHRFLPSSLRAALAGRSATLDALRQGATCCLVTTSQCATLLPARAAARYLIYGDATTEQLATMYRDRTSGLIGSALFRRLKTLAKEGHYLLCVSNWYLNALRDDLGIADRQLVLLPFYVDTDRWTPGSRPAPQDRIRFLFVGADWQRKGGDVIDELAASAPLSSCEFHVVSPQATSSRGNVIAHRHLRSDARELVELVQSCDVFILPTRADCSSIAAIEAASCGLPAIISDVGGIGDIVIDGKTGFLNQARSVASFRALAMRYYESPELIRIHGAAARRRIEDTFSKKNHLRILRACLSACGVHEELPPDAGRNSASSRAR